MDLSQQQGSLQSRDGTEIFFRFWTPERARGVLQIVHGLGEHSGRYEHVARHFGALGYAVSAFDLRGHGHSGGQRGHIDSMEDFFDDVAAAEVHLQKLRGDPGAAGADNAFLVGHSMGGLIALLYAVERHCPYRGVVLSGPALGIPKPTPALRAKIIIGKGLSRILPRLAMNNGVDPLALSHDPEVCRRYSEDPLVHPKITTRMATELFAAMERTAEGASRLRVPVLFLHGTDDQLTAPSGSQACYDAMPKESDREIRLFPGYYHEIFNEVGKEDVFAVVAGWLEKKGLAG